MSDSSVIMWIVFIGFWIFTAAAMALLITCIILSKYSDFGDSSCQMREYAPRAINFFRSVDDAGPVEHRHLMADYGVDPYKDNKHRIPEVLIKNADKNEEKI